MAPRVPSRCLSLILAALLAGSASAIEYAFQGRVYEGSPPDQDRPLAGVTVEVWATNQSGQLQQKITEDQTDRDGFYRVIVDTGDYVYDYYILRERNPQDYVSVDARTVSGDVLDADRIQFGADLAGRDLTGNTFWDEPAGPPPDRTPPHIIALSPPDDATGVAVNTTLAITFDEPIQAGSGNVTLYRGSDGSVVENFTVPGASASLAGSTATFTPSSPLAPATAYYVLMDAGTVRDLAGNAGPSLAAPTAWNFTTAETTGGSATIRGHKFHDLNRNGRRDPDEPPVAGWIIHLGGEDVSAQRTITNRQGAYAFGELEAGIYRLWEEPREGWTRTYPPDPGVHEVTVDKGQLVSDIDFGNVQGSAVVEERTDTFDLCLELGVYDPEADAITTVSLRGRATQRVTFDGPLGTARDDDADGFDEVVTELVSLSLTGQHPVYGAVTLSLPVGLPASGRIQEQANPTPGTLDLPPYAAGATADSFFDVFVELGMPDLGLVLISAGPLRLEAVLDRLVPNQPNQYTGGTNLSLDLADQNGQPTGLQLVSLLPCGGGGGDGDTDFGDAPDPGYRTLLANDGARHRLDPDVFLGLGVDADPDGQPDIGARGDDLDGNDDEDGVVFTGPLTAGTTVPVTVTASVPGRLDAWIDFQDDGVFDVPADVVFAGQVLHSGPQTLTVQVPASAAASQTYARFRFSRAGGLSPQGPAPDGEVEDYAVEIAAGGGEPEAGSVTVMKDAEPADDTAFHFTVWYRPGPDFQLSDDRDLWDPSQYPAPFAWTVAHPNAVASVTEAPVPGWALFSISIGGDRDGGSVVDEASATVYVDHDPGEEIVITFHNGRAGTPGGDYDFGDAPDSYGTLHASGGPYHDAGDVMLGRQVDTEPDGQPGPLADGDADDGVTFSTALQVGRPATAVVNVTSLWQVPAAVVGWIDFDHSGTFEEPGERIVSGTVMGTGALLSWPQSFTVPATAQAGPTYARFRIYRTELGVDVLPAPGGYGQEGEVEDYRVVIVPADPFPPGEHRISGLAFHDLDTDGAWEPADGESGLSGWTIWLDAHADGTRDATAVTDAQGRFAFGGYGPGTYRIGQDTQPGWLQTFPISPDTFTFTIPGGPASTISYFLFGDVTLGAFDGDLDFGDAPEPYPVAAHVTAGPWLGSLSDGPDQEAGMQRDPQAAGDDTDPTGDDEDGVQFLQADLQWISYLVAFSGGTGSQQTFAAWLDLNQDGDWDDPNERIGYSVAPPSPPGTSIAIAVMLSTPPEALPGLTMARFRVYDGNVPASPGGLARSGEVEDHAVEIAATPVPGTDTPRPGIVHGFKFDDRNGNGHWDGPFEPGGEPALPGWRIWLDANGNGEPDAGDPIVETDPSGYFRFDGLADGTYLVGEEQRPGWTATTPEGGQALVTVAHGQPALSVLFGNRRGDAPDRGAPLWEQPPLAYDPGADSPAVFCGWDEMAWAALTEAGIAPLALAADDVRLAGPAPITDLRWWGSHPGWAETSPPTLQPEGWLITIWANGSTFGQVNQPYPQQLIWRVEVPAERVQRRFVGTDEFPERPADSCFRYDLSLTEAEWFRPTDLPTEDRIYWLGITALYAQPEEVSYPWGWKTRPHTYGEAARRIDAPAPLEIGLLRDGGQTQALVTPPSCPRPSDLCFELRTGAPWTVGPATTPAGVSCADAGQASWTAGGQGGATMVVRQVFDDWVPERPGPVTGASWYGAYPDFNAPPCTCERPRTPPRPDAFQLSIWRAGAPPTALWTYRAERFEEVLVGTSVYRYHVSLPEDRWPGFDDPEPLWFSVMAVYDDGRNAQPWTWCARTHSVGETAQARRGSDPTWRPLSDPAGEPTDMRFTLDTLPPGPPEGAEAVARTIRDRLLGGDFDGQVLWMTPEPLDETFVARDRDPEQPDRPFPPGARSWLVMIDEHPPANWGHDVTWVFVREDLSEVTPLGVRHFPPGVYADRGRGPRVDFGPVDLPVDGLGHLEPDPPLAVPPTLAEPVNDCLHAVLISGGIDSQSNYNRYAQNLSSMYRQLLRCGAQPANIWVYYADGRALDLDNADGDNNASTGSDVTAAANETTIRNRIQGLRDGLDPSRDILLVFTSNHGDDNRGLCLWDTNNNTTLEAGEIYTPAELGADTANARVRRLFLILDQCFSGEFLPLATDGRHAHSAVYVAAGADEASYGRQYMALWEQRNAKTTTLNAMHPTSLVPPLAPPPNCTGTCTSTPGTAEGTKGNGDITLANCPFNRPDLVPVKGAGRASFCDPDGKGNLRVHVKNQGMVATVGAELEVRFQLAPGYYRAVRGAHGPLAPGQTDTVLIAIPPGCANPDCDFTITVDIVNTVVESDEANNTAAGLCTG